MKPWAMRWLSGLLLLALTTAASPAMAQRVTVSPAQPTATDSVKVTAISALDCASWSLDSYGCAVVAPDTLAITVNVLYCHGGSECVCDQWPIRYERTCTFAPLLPGTYVARFIQNRLNNPYPYVPDRLTFTTAFTVTGSTPTVRRSWGALKLHHR